MGSRLREAQVNKGDSRRLLIPTFSIQLGGSTSIDVTRPGIDKAYGVKKLHETLGIAIADMIFVGDAIFPGGNDYPAEQAGAESIRVRDPHETKRVVEAICACLETGDSHRPACKLSMAALSNPIRHAFGTTFLPDCRFCGFLDLAAANELARGGKPDPWMPVDTSYCR